MKRKTGYMRKKPCLSFCWLNESAACRHRARAAHWLACLCLSVFSATNPALAQTPAQCAQTFTDARQLPSESAPPGAGQTRIAADSTRIDEQLTIFEGDVVIQQSQRSMLADTASFDKANNRLSLGGNLYVETGGMQFRADAAVFDDKQNRAQLDQAEYIINNGNLRGSADAIVITDTGDTLTTLSQSSLTSCPPDKQDWRLSADEIVLNHNDEYGSADNVVIEFMGVPFFYTPYLEFPIGDKRRSGLLIPEWSDSSSRGFELVMPWYWNIAPNQDATLAPHFMQKRGLQLDTRYRFLTRSTRGELKSAYLGNDKVVGKARYHTEYKQRSRLSDKLSLNIDIRDVSDINYFTDFSNSLSDTSQTHLNRSAELVYRYESWRSRLRVQTYETVNASILPADRPYRKLPQFTLSGRQPLGDSGLQLDLKSEWVLFDHKDNSKTTGSRLHIAPTLSWPLQRAAWYVRPAVQLNHTQYNVEDGNGNALNLDSRNLAVNSLDSGLIFERTLGNGLLQTLEPRLFYLYAPYRDQSALPIFDSNTPTFSFAQLFRNNRFNGVDRIGDANQLTAALSTRFTDPGNGNEYFRASIGQIFYFDDRRVSLDNSVASDASSDLIAELSGNWRNWQTRASAQWDTDAASSERQNFTLHYQSDNRHIFNLSWRQQRDDNSGSDIEQTDVSFVAPLSARTIAFARWNYSLAEKQDIDLIAGLGYENCCWSLQILTQRQRLPNTSNQYDNSLMFQLVLKGLGSVSGNRLSNTLKNAIPGYKPD